MNLERQRQIIKEKHGPGMYIRQINSMGTDLLVLYDNRRDKETKLSAPMFRCRALRRCPGEVWVEPFNPDPAFHIRVLHNFVAAVTYAKAELARLAAAEETP
jgi:hypothetical protein